MTPGPIISEAARPPVTVVAPATLIARARARIEIGLASDGDRGRVQRNAVYAFSVRVASAALLYLSQIVLARWMGATEFGIYVLVWTWVLVLGGLSHLGLSMTMIRLLPEYTETRRLDLLRGLIRGGRWVALGIGTLLAALGMLGLWLFGQHLQPHTLLPAYLALVCVPLYALTDLQDGVGRGRGWLGVALVPPYILRPLVLLLAMLAAHALELPMTAATAAAAAIAATWCAAVVQTLVVQRRLKTELPAGPRAYAFGSWLRMAAPLLVIYGAELVMQNADVILLAAYRPAGDVGMYFAAAKTMALVMFVHYAVGSAAAHRFSALNARGDTVGLAAAVRDGVRWTFFPSFAAAVVIVALGKPLLWLFSPEFTVAYPVMLILVVGFLARAAVGPAEFLLNMLGQQKASAAVALVSATVNVVLNLILIPRFGIYGAATATAGALVFGALANFTVARRYLGLNISIFQNLK
jgi:O-antigen/teichoic acid export membrane protein